MIQIKNKFIKNEKGNALLWTMMFMTIFFLLASTMAVVTIAEIRQSSKIDSSTEAYLLTEAGAERAKKFAEYNQVGIKTGTIANNTYSFQVVKATPGSPVNYDNNLHQCIAGATDKYCYSSQATVGNIRRKIDGSRSDVSLDQGKTVNVYDSSLVFNPNLSYLKMFNMTPASIPSPTSEFNYSVTMENLNATSSYAWRVGLLDTSRTLTCTGYTGYPGIMMSAVHSTGNVRSFEVNLVAVNASGNIGWCSTGTPISISIDDASVDKVKLTLVFKKVANNLSQNTITLYVRNVANGKCLNAKSFSGNSSFQTLGDISPFYAFFYGTGVTFGTDPSDGQRKIQNTQGGVSRFYQGPYLRIR